MRFNNKFLEDVFNNIKCCLPSETPKVVGFIVEKYNVDWYRGELILVNLIKRKKIKVENGVVYLNEGGANGN